MRVTIPEPCSENWELMGKTADAARFCASCQKCVVDFSAMSDRDILNRLNASDDNVCGRFTNAQLDRVLAAQTYKPRNYWSAFFSVALTSVVALQNSVQMKLGLKPKVEISTTAKRVVEENKIEGGGRDSVTIRGIVIDAESSEPISGASVYMKDVAIHSVSQTNGTFEIKIHDRYLGEKIVLSVIHPSANRTEFSFSKKDLLKPFVLKLVYVEQYIKGKVAIYFNNDSTLNKLINAVMPKNK